MLSFNICYVMSFLACNKFKKKKTLMFIYLAIQRSHLPLKLLQSILMRLSACIAFQTDFLVLTSLGQWKI